MARRTGVILVLVAMLMAGCNGSPSQADGRDEAVESSSMAVFDSEGRLLDVSAWHGGSLVPVDRQLERAAREPTLGVDPDGNVFVGVWDQEDYANVESLDDDELGKVLSVYASFDQGATWRNVRPAPLILAQIPPTTSDAFFEVDPVTGRLLANDWTYGCSTMAISDDDGESWVHSPLGCGPGIGAIDHQSITTGEPRVSSPIEYPRMVYYCVASQCSASVDGGLTFGPSVSVFCETAGECTGANGHVKTDADGRVMLGASRGGVPHVAVSEDDGATWRSGPVNETVGTYYHDVEVAADSNGTMYAVWNADDGFVYYATSIDHGQSWSPAVNVVPPGLTVASFPMVVAGGPGEMAVLFLGTNHSKAYLPGTHPSDRMGDMYGALWHWYLTVSLNATGDSPVFASVPLTGPDDPAAADACWPGWRHCEDVGEFVDLVIGPDGRPWASVFDSCREKCDRLGGNEEPGDDRGKVLTLSDGPALNGSLERLTPLPYASNLQ